jgi:YHS domain-containing protein
VIRVLLIAALMFLIARAFWRVVDGIMEGVSGASRGGRTQPRPVKLARDPVCGTHVPVNASVALTVGGTTHYFCSEACRDRFRRAS